MSGSCQLDRASNVEIGVECQIFVIVIVFNCSRVLQFGAHSRYYKGALTQKRLFLVDSVLATDFMKPKLLNWHKIFDLIGITRIDSNFDERTGLITFVLKKFYLFNRTQQFIIGSPEDLNSPSNRLR